MAKAKVLIYPVVRVVRGDHSCPALIEAETEMEWPPLAKEVTFIGSALKVTHCGHCPVFQGIRAGSQLYLQGSYDPKTYGHDGLQL